MDKKEFRILIAEDDSLVREAVRQLLTREGYNVVTAVDGLEAMKVLTMDELDLVVTDLRMPGAGGLDVLRQVQRATPDTAVIIMTAYGTLETALEAMRQGAFDYLTKPFQIEQMTLAVEKAYRWALLLRENKELRRCLREAYREAEAWKSSGKREDAEIAAIHPEGSEPPRARTVATTAGCTDQTQGRAGDNGKS